VHRQPTYQTARASASGIELLRLRDGVDYGGDGTVPRPSAHPPEWELETSGDTIGYSQRHATLQETREVLTQMFTRLTGDRLGSFMGEEDLALDAPNVLSAGEDLQIEAQTRREDLALVASLTAHGQQQPISQPVMAALGEGRYRTTIAGVSPGLYELTVAGRAGATTPVSDVVTVWDERPEH